VRVQIAERVLVTWIVLDLSPSMAFGTADRRKADVAEGVALAVAVAMRLIFPIWFQVPLLTGPLEAMLGLY
jgi:uncharacterized protein (DUF58 family)